MTIIDLINYLVKELNKIFTNTKRKLFHDTNRHLTIPGIMESASQSEGGIPRYEEINSMLKIADKYLESLEGKTAAKLSALVSSFKTIANPSKKIQNSFIKDMKQIFSEAEYQLETIVNTEIQNAKAIALLNGISRINIFHGIKDPVVFWVVVNDSKLCVECQRLHLLPDGSIPRLWYLSEVKRGYAKRGDTVPSLSEQHPNGRCVLTTLLPGYGFDTSGKVTYIKAGFLALQAQRGN